MPTTSYYEYPFNASDIYTSQPGSTIKYSSYPNAPTDFSAYTNDGDDRFIGAGFIAPFLLGGLTGAALARPRCCWGNPWVRPVWPVATPYPVPPPVPYTQPYPVNPYPYRY